MTSAWRPGTSVAVAVPASSANLGPGFDSVGVALEIRDRCWVTISRAPGVRVRVAGEGADTVPTDERHLVARSMLRTWDLLGVTPPSGLALDCHNNVPHGRGLGSSATAIVTGIGLAFALTLLASDGVAAVDRDAANDIAAEFEGHPDNSSASVFGGLTVSWPELPPEPRPYARTRTCCFTPHPEVEPILFVPPVELSTATARAVLPTHVRLGDAAANSARAALLVHAITSAPALLVAATRDWLHQEARRPSYPESMDLVDRLRSIGHAAVISGAGPSVLVLGHAAAVEGIRRFSPAGWRALTPGFASSGIVVLDGNAVAPERR